MVGDEHMEQNDLAGEMAGIAAAAEWCKWGCRTWFDPGCQGRASEPGILELGASDVVEGRYSRTRRRQDQKQDGRR